MEDTITAQQLNSLVCQSVHHSRLFNMKYFNRLLSELLTAKKQQKTTLHRQRQFKNEEHQTPTSLIFAQNFNWRRPLGITNLLITFFQRISFQTLPRQTATQEVQEHMTKSF